MTPVIYNDPRFVETTKERVPEPFPHHMMHTDQPEKTSHKSNDTTPLDYSKGPHDDEFGVDEDEPVQSNDEPVPYDNGPNDDEFGVDDEE